MLGSGVFQLWMVPSTPPLKHCSPLELMATHSTAPLQRGRRHVATATTNNQLPLRLYILLA